MAIDLSRLKPKNLLDVAKIAGGYVSGNPALAASGATGLYGTVTGTRNALNQNVPNPTLNMKERLLGDDVGRLLKQREALAQQMIQGVPDAQQQQIFSTAQDAAAMQNQQMGRNIAMQGMGGPGYQNMLGAINEQRRRANAADQIAALQPQYMQQGIRELGGIQDIYQDVQTAQYNQAFADFQQGRQNTQSNLADLLEAGPSLLKAGMNLYNTYQGGQA